MEDQDQILIERYLAGELTESEQQEVEQRKKEDPLFRQEVMSYEIAKEALRRHHREELRRRFVARDMVLDKKKPELTNSGRRRYFLIWVVGAVIIFGLWIWKYLFSAGHEVNPLPVVKEDSLRIEQTLPVQQDTLGTKGSEEKEEIPEKELKSNRQKPPMADAGKKNEELFAAYFEPYKDDLMNPATRGETALSPLEIFQKAYWEADYLKAVQSFRKLAPSFTSNDNFRFSFASALLATGNTNEAITVLESILQHGKSRYRTEARFTLALAFLKKGEPAKTSSHLDIYIADIRARQLEEAKRLRAEIMNN